MRNAKPNVIQNMKYAIEASAVALASLFFGAMTLAAIFLVSSTSWAAVAKPAQVSAYVMCKSNKTVRTIRVEKDNVDKQCVAVYTKAGVDQEVGRAQTESSCAKVVGNIKANLEGANWKCREVSGVNITTSKND